MDALQVMSVIGMTGQTSVTRTVALGLEDRLKEMGAEVDSMDFGVDPLPLFDAETSYSAEYYAPLRDRVARADVFILATPDYHGCMSSALKCFLDHFWKEYAGRLFAPMVASYDKGLTATDQIRTVARQCYAWTMPYAVSFQEHRDANAESGALTDEFKERLELFAQDILTYGTLLRDQRGRDLQGTGPGFMARYRS